MKLRIIQILSVAVLVLFILALVQEETPVDLTLSEVEEMLLEKTELEGMTASDSLRFKRAYGLNAEDYEWVLYYEPETTMDVSELLIVKILGSDQAATVSAAMESRISQQENNFDGYGTDQLAILEDAIVYSNDMYVCLLISADSRTLMEAVRDIVEE